MRVLAVAAALTAAIAVSACGADKDPAAASRITNTPEATHIHGLGINPADDALMVATHRGLFRAKPGSAELTRVGDSARDTMGFSVVGPDRFLASGHPEAGSDEPPLSGLLRSSDGGETWHPAALYGEADLHTIRTGKEVFYAQDAHRNRLFLGSSGGSGLLSRSTPTGTTIDLAVDPGDDDRVFASTDRGLFLSPDGARRWKRVDPRRVGLIAFTAGNLVSVGEDGTVSSLPRLGAPWKKVGTVPGRPVALTATADGTLLAANQDGEVYTSPDGGRRWKPRLTGPPAP